MIDFHSYLAELFERPFPVREKKREGHGLGTFLIYYEANIDKNNHLLIEIAKVNDQWEIHFMVNGSTKLTHEGKNAFRIFASVMEAVKMFLKWHKEEFDELPIELVMISKTDESKRDAIYSALMRKFGKEYGYQIVSREEFGKTEKKRTVTVARRQVLSWDKMKDHTSPPKGMKWKDPANPLRGVISAMESVRLDEIEQVEVDKDFIGVDKMQNANLEIADNIYSDWDMTRIGNIGKDGEYGVVMFKPGKKWKWNSKAGWSMNSRNFLVVHRPSNKIAASLECTVNKEKAIEVDGIEVGGKYRKSIIGKSLAIELYKKISSKGFTIRSGEVQSKGGRSIWERLLLDNSWKKRINVLSKSNGSKLKSKKFAKGDETAVFDTDQGSRLSLDPAKKMPRGGLKDAPRTHPKASKQFKPGTFWKTDTNKYGAKNRRGVLDYFDDRQKAERWVRS